ncbi:MAG: molybdopterin-guanine dinucleotide biosynthesis protein B [Paracoccaceae bacterium]|jgi:molybdopterin-guanine dinucleotide biosynthesis protein B
MMGPFLTQPCSGASSTWKEAALCQFDRIIVVDWSAAATLTAKVPCANAIWIGIADENGDRTDYFRTRSAAESALQAHINSGVRLLIGVDFPLGFPIGFGQELLGSDDPSGLWQWVASQITDAPDNSNNRFHVAQRVNLAIGEPKGQMGPFWGCPNGLGLKGLSPKKSIDYSSLGFAEKRLCEKMVPKSQAIWKLYTTGSVGSQSLMGMGMIARLLARGAKAWPFDPVVAQDQIVLAEVYPSLIDPAVFHAVGSGQIKDAAQTQLLARALFNVMEANGLKALFESPPQTAQVLSEGWILGIGHQAQLLAALKWAADDA